MRTRLPIFTLLVLICVRTILACMPVSAQDTPGAFRGGLADRFDRVDRDGDGKITARELPRPEIFDRLDRNGDGVIERSEIQGAGKPATDGKVQARITEKLDLAFGNHPAQRLDLYQPVGVKDAPIMVYVHGGGWKRGDKRAVGEKVKFFIGRGWVFVSVNYRLLPEGRHPVNVNDVALALAWVHNNAREYGGNPNQLFVMGHSAGAHLAAMVVTSEKPLQEAGKTCNILKGVIALDTNAYDLPVLMRSSAASFYGQVFGEDHALWKDASPSQHVAKGKGIPPFLICYSRGMRTRTNPERAKHANAFAKKLRAAGFAAEIVDASDRNHAEINQRFGRADDAKVTGTAARFLDAIVGGKTIGDTNPEAQVPKAETASQGDSAVHFTRNYVPGTRDRNGQFMGGVELMRLATHRGHLYAALGYATDRRGDDPSPGAQILVKGGPNEPWEVDRNFPRASRVNALEPATFTTDHAGQPLAKPVTLLVADAASFALSREPRALVCLVRNDKTGRWEESPISPRAPRAYVRAFGCHRDRETGIDFIFAGTGAGEIYAGVYEPTAPGQIRWNPKPEYVNPAFTEEAAKFKRVSAFCEANGDAFCSVSPRLVRRVDGKEPRWQEVFRWEVAENKYGAGLRGITAIPARDGNHEVIIGSRERPGKILRIDPKDDFRAEVELDSRAFLQEKWGVRQIGGGLTAYNRFVPGTHPHTGEPIHWVTIAAMKPGDTNAAWLLIRNADTTYEIVRVFDPALEEHPRLLSTRTVEIAPWNDRNIYTGGYDLWGNNQQNHNTAWIFQGTLSERKKEP